MCQTQQRLGSAEQRSPQWLVLPTWSCVTWPWWSHHPSALPPASALHLLCTRCQQSRKPMRVPWWSQRSLFSLVSALTWENMKQIRRDLCSGRAFTTVDVCTPASRKQNTKWSWLLSRWTRNISIKHFFSVIFHQKAYTYTHTLSAKLDLKKKVN